MKNKKLKVIGFTITGVVLNKNGKPLKEKPSVYNPTIHKVGKYRPTIHNISEV